MQRRRFFQTSIRAILILTTLVAIALGFWTRFIQRVREQRVATSRIPALGGKTKAEQTTNGWPRLQQAIGEDLFQEIVAIDLNETLVSDADLELIGKLRGVKSLSVMGAMPRFCGMAPPLAHNPKHLPSQITSAGIRRLGSQRTMQTARFPHTPITDAALETIAFWSQLEVLDLQKTKITSRGIQHLQKLERLHELDLSATKIDDDAVPALCQMSSLRKLDIQSTAVSGEGVLRLRDALPSCCIWGDLLDISMRVGPDPESMRWKKDITIVRTFTHLRLLILADSAVTDVHLQDMGQLENIDVIDLRRTKVTAGGIASLQRALPKCKIYR